MARLGREWFAGLEERLAELEACDGRLEEGHLGVGVGLDSWRGGVDWGRTVFVIYFINYGH